MGNNHVQVSKGFRILLSSLAPYMAREFKNEYGDNWWEIAVIDILYDEQKRDLPLSGDWATLVDSLDIARSLLLFDLHWQRVFRKKLSIDYRTWAKELVGVRNRLAHLGGKDFSKDDTWRALDTMSRLSDQIDPEGAEEIRSILRESRYGTPGGSTSITSGSMNASPTRYRRDTGILSNMPIASLPSWRDVMEPHPDVAQGRYKNAEFAADLAQVARGEGAYEYRDPVEFFARTYVTEGMAGLLEQSLRRISGKDGEPVIQLKTAFGGGKTHSMLALYHLLRGKITLDKIPNVKFIVERAGLDHLPKANVAVLVGTALDPTKARRPVNMPGITINTLWGEMAAQLAASAGDLKLYDYVKEADKKGVSPGSEALKNLFDACAPSVVLIDELVTYAKKLYGAKNLPAGTFDNFIAFVQEITEAARASKNSIVVASIPESVIEIGGEAGQLALVSIEHTFGRMEAIWKPVTADEGFEVVRRRLFLDCKDVIRRDEVCATFSKMYRENQSDFPIETKELEYMEKMRSCYPIHPEVFDRLYEDWATIERFQRTRGVLRLMASVIHELWMGSDAGFMIMPGSLPLDVPNVRDELTRHLPEGWNAVVDREVDGRNSNPYKIDQANPRYGGRLIARRVARTVMLGSAPTVKEQDIRGIETSRIRLGTVQPGENIANFNDALNTLTSSLSYLYSNPSNDRYWYDTRPTLKKTVEDRATQIAPSDVEYEIETRLRSLRGEQPFSGIHICPSSSLDIPDEQSSRLVILDPAKIYKASNPNNEAMDTVVDILNNRGKFPRIYRNMLAFVVADQDLMTSLKETVRYYLAWQSIKDDSEDLNLDAAQNRDTENNLNRYNRTVKDQIREAYCWLLVPYIDKEQDLKTILWYTVRISGGTDSIVLKAGKKMLQNEQIITKWAPLLLLREMDNLLWQESNHISIKQLWDYLCTYCYLPRLANEDVLLNTIKLGIKSEEYFAYAAGFDGNRYIDLKFNQYVGTVDRSAYLVKSSSAKAQLEEEAKRRAEVELPEETKPPCSLDSKTTISKIISTTGEEVTDEPVNKRFFMSAQLDTTRIGRDVQRLVEEVINHLVAVEGSNVEISLELNVTAPDGMSQQVVRTVTENCRTLKIKSFGFDG